MREIQLSDTHLPDGGSQKNEPVRVYDTSGPWGDPDFHGNIELGLPKLREDWILGRKDVEKITDVKVAQRTMDIYPPVTTKEPRKDRRNCQISTVLESPYCGANRVVQLPNFTMQERESLLRKWNLLPFGKT